MLKAQEKAIDRLRADSGLVFLEEFPTDSIFKENEFVELDNGVYLNIVNKGNSERAVLGQTAIRSRFIARMFMETVAWEPVLSTCSVLIQTVHIR